MSEAYTFTVGDPDEARGLVAFIRETLVSVGLTLKTSDGGTPCAAQDAFVASATAHDNDRVRVIRDAGLTGGVPLHDIAAPLRIEGKSSVTLDRDALAAQYVDRAACPGVHATGLATGAYLFADAMIAESAKGQSVPREHDITAAQLADYRKHEDVDRPGRMDLNDAIREAGYNGNGLLMAEAAKMIRSMLAERETARANAATLDKIADTVRPVRADGETVLGCIQGLVPAAVESKRIRKAVASARESLAAASVCVNVIGSVHGSTLNRARLMVGAAIAELATIPDTDEWTS